MQGQISTAVASDRADKEGHRRIADIRSSIWCCHFLLKCVSKTTGKADVCHDIGHLFIFILPNFSYHLVEIAQQECSITMY